MAAIDALFDALLARKGSDLHLAVGYPPMIRARGELVAVGDEGIDGPGMESLLFELLDDAQREQITSELDLDFAHAYGQEARFRANYFHRNTGLGAVFRT